MKNIALGKAPQHNIGEVVYLKNDISENPHDWEPKIVLGLIADIARQGDLEETDLAYLYVLSSDGLYKYSYPEEAILSESMWQLLVAKWDAEQQEIYLQQQYEEELSF